MFKNKDLKIGGITFLVSGIFWFIIQLLEKSKGKASRIEHPKPDPIHSKLELEYAQVNENIREFMTIRFKLLGFLPTLGGVAVFVLSFLGLSPDNTTPVTTQSQLWLVCLVSSFGFIATLGVIVYDQRNSELYNALIHRAKFLETLFQSPNSPGALRKRLWGGQFQERPDRSRRWLDLFSIGHDIGLSLIYGPILGAWFFPFTISLLKLFNLTDKTTLPLAVAMTLSTSMGFAGWLIHLDQEDSKLWNAAGKAAVLVLVEKTAKGFEARIPIWPDIVVRANGKDEILKAVRREIKQERILAQVEGGQQIEPALFAYYL